MNTDSTVLISKYLKEYNHIYKEANDIYHEIARKLQLSDSALDIFYTIFEMGDNCLQRDICKASCMPKQTVNSSIRKLQTDGYLTLSPGKGRSMHIHLTPSGQKLIQEKLVPLIRIENDAFEDMTVEECEQLIHLNAKYNQTLRSRLSNLEAVAGSRSGGAEKKYAGDGCSLSVPMAWVRRLPSILRLQVWG